MLTDALLAVATIAFLTDAWLTAVAAIAFIINTWVTLTDKAKPRSPA